jgi:hypothetical protein
MVEFGLKLEDNKVSEWSQFYIDYDKLKDILKKAKAAEKKFEELAKKRPDEAAKIKVAYMNGDTDYVTNTPRQSGVNLAKVAEAEAEAAAATESTRLLVRSSPTPEPDTDPNDNNDIDTTPDITTDPQSTTTTTGYLASAFDISGFFGSRYERNLRDNLNEIDNRGKEFEESLLGEIKKVGDFYASKLEELETRFEHLVEAVASSYDINPLPPLSEGSVASGSQAGGGGVLLPMRRGHPRRKSGLMELVSRISVMIKEESKKKKKEHFAESLSLHATDDNSDDEGEGDTQTSSAKGSHKKSGEADSIKRALVDHYRSAKLLHNFVNMNYTGFVKIVKKHDKSIPEQKGRFKQAIEPKNLCDEGKEVEELSNRFEKYFANWFCEGDLRAAHAQMLPKRGDGLEMDWSQLRCV